METIKIEELDNGQIIKVILNRPKSLNAMNPKFFQELKITFEGINKRQNARVAILVGEGRVFCAGLDLKEYGGVFVFDQTVDPARRAIKLYDGIRFTQFSLQSLVQCRVPVLVGIHGACVGGGVDLISMADIRYCTQDIKFTIKEVDIGQAPDMGTLQFLPSLTGNESTLRQLAYTARFFGSQEAKQIGLVTKIFSNKQQLQEGLLETARVIASKSPVAIYAIKQTLKRQIHKKVYQSLEYVVRLNSAMITTKDTQQAITAFLNKRKPTFPKL